MNAPKGPPNYSRPDWRRVDKVTGESSRILVSQVVRAASIEWNAHTSRYIFENINNGLRVIDTHDALFHRVDPEIVWTPLAEKMPPYNVKVRLWVEPSEKGIAQHGDWVRRCSMFGVKEPPRPTRARAILAKRHHTDEHGEWWLRWRHFRGPEDGFLKLTDEPEQLSATHWASFVVIDSRVKQP